MKTRLLFALILSFSFYLTSGQIPQGFTYQAIARDGANPVATPVSVMLTVQSTDVGGTTFWIELHSGVQPNASGLFSLIVGNGVKQPGSTVNAFGDIDWSVSPKYLKTQIDIGSGFVTMGTSQLVSVPYSLVAESLAGPVKKLDVTGTTTNMDEALFEVKNKTGQTVFAVYSEGVRIYVDDGDAKGVKGGFAIGGFGTAKATTQNLFVVNPDSIRAYIDTNPAKGIKGGFAIGGFSVAKESGVEYLRVTRDSTRVYVDDTPGKGVKGGFAIGGFDIAKGNTKNFLNVATDNTGIVNPPQNKILWYPLKNAFLTGQVLIHHPDSIGLNSTTTGYESRAKGEFSQAMGYKAIARGDFSTAIGKNAIAHKNNSFAFGENSYAGNLGSFALGVGSKATGLGSFALGFEGRDSINNLTGATVASGEYSMSLGMGAKSYGKGSLAVGTMAEAYFGYSTAIGYQTKAQNWYATAVGYKTQANGLYSSAFGYRSRADGESAVALGRSSAGGKLSTALGNSYAQGEYSVSMGNSSVASGYTSIAAGYENSAVGDYSAAFGSGTFSSGLNSSAFGYSTIAEADYSNAIGLWNIGFKVYPTMDITDPLYNPLLEVGNGSGLARSNALTVLRNGQILVGTHSAQFIEDQIMYDDPPHTMNIQGRRPWDDEYYGLFVKGETMIEGNIVPSTIDYYSIGSSGAPWKSVYASNYYGNGASAYFYTDILPSGTRNIGSSTYRWNTAYINTYYGNSSNNAVFAAALLPSGTRNLGSSTTPWNAAYVTTYYGNTAGNAVFAVPVLPSGSQNLGSSAAYWSSLYANQIKVNGTSGLAELQYTKSGTYAGAVGYNFTDNYLYLYEGDNVSIKDGKVGIGSVSPGYKLDVFDNSASLFAARIFHDGNSSTTHGLMIQAGFDATNANEIGMIGFYDGDGTYEGAITLTNGTLALIQNSDRRLKEDIRNTQLNALEMISRMRVVDYKFKDGSGKYNTGYIAQELLDINPDLVSYNTTEDIYGVDYFRLIPLLNRAIQQQEEKIESVQQENLLLKSELQFLKERMAQIEVLLLKNNER